MFLKVLLIIAIALEFVFVPIFLKHYWPEKCKKSWFYKMVCATLFVVCGLLSMKISGNNSPYAELMMWGLVLGWIGDLLLHALSKNQIYFIIGFLSFLAGHIVYIDAFYKAIKTTYPDASMFAWYQIVFSAVLFIGMLVFAVVKKMLNKKTWYVAIGFAAYAFILSSMLSQAFRYAIGEIAYGTNNHMFMVFLTVAIGSLLFFLSDASLGVILVFNKKARGWRIFNIATYFSAQVLLACSILFVQSQQIIGG